jgi:DNA-binding Xre family transcriptional regulator
MPVIESSYAKAFRLHIRALMVEREISAMELAVALGLSKNTMHSRLRGVTKFTLDELDKLARVLNVDPVDLWPIVTDEEAS